MLARGVARTHKTNGDLGYTIQGSGLQHSEEQSSYRKEIFDVHSEDPSGSKGWREKLVKMWSSSWRWFESGTEPTFIL